MEPSLRSKAQSIWHIQRVKRLVRARLGGGAQCLISVREAYCRDPGCEGPITEIRIVSLGFRELKGVIHACPSEVQQADIADLF